MSRVNRLCSIPPPPVRHTRGSKTPPPPTVPSTCTNYIHIYSLGYQGTYTAAAAAEQDSYCSVTRDIGTIASVLDAGRWVDGRARRKLMMGAEVYRGKVVHTADGALARFQFHLRETVEGELIKNASRVLSRLSCCTAHTYFWCV